MTKILKLFLLASLPLSIWSQSSTTDRSGEAGAYELLINPHARTMGMMAINSASVSGTDAFGSNIAGLAMNKKVSIFANYTSWLTGTETQVMNIGTAFEISNGNNIGFNVNFLNFGKLQLTTVDNPTPIGTFSPYMLNLGFSFARRFSKYVNGGIQLKMISEGISNVTASGAALDAGLQYITGDMNDIHFGVFIRNIGFPMEYSGNGLTVKRPDPKNGQYDIPFNFRAAKFELPAQFSIAGTKDFYFGVQPEDKTKYCRPAHRLSVSANFLYNAFINNDFGIGGEYAYQEKYSFRLGYVYQDNAFSKDETKRAHMGLAAGFGIEWPLNKEKNPSIIELAYNYRPSWVFAGTHNLGVTYTIAKPNSCDEFVAPPKKITIEEAKSYRDTIRLKPDVIYKTDTVKITLPNEIKTEVQYRDVNKIFKDFSKSIEFKLASAKLTSKGEGALDVIGDLMKNYPESRFNIAGHTDEMGKPENNMLLSKNRATAVAKFLIERKAIPESSLNVEWFGEERPIADNKTEEGRSKNRRVEITVIDEGNLQKSYTPTRNTGAVRFESPIDNKPLEPQRKSKTNQTPINDAKSPSNSDEEVSFPSNPKVSSSTNTSPSIPEVKKTIPNTTKPNINIPKPPVPVTPNLKLPNMDKPANTVPSGEPLRNSLNNTPNDAVENAKVSSNDLTESLVSDLQKELNEDAQNIKFVESTDSLTRGARRTITKIHAMLSDAPFQSIKIISHTDKGTKSVSNLELTVSRANKIKEQLIERGLPAEKIIIEGKGDSELLDTSDSPEAIEKNNRISLILTK